MNRKIFSACAIFFINLNIANASVSAPYLGAEIGNDNGNWKIQDVTNVKTNAHESGMYGGVFAGWGWDATQHFYIAAEAFGNESAASTSTYTINTATVPANISMRMRYTLGGSLLPGFKFNDASLLFLRVSGLRSRFNTNQSVVPASATSNLDRSSVFGGQLGIGLQGNFANNLSVRGEFDYTAYRSFHAFNNVISARDNQIKIGVLYNFC